MKRKIISSLLIILLLLLNCHRSSSKTDNKIHIYTSIFPVYDIVKQITSTNIDVNYAIPIGANPHTFEATPELAMKLKSAKIFIGIDPNLDGWIKSFLASDTKIIYLSQYIQDLNHATEPTDVHYDENSHHKNNPHFWLSISKVKIILPSLVNDLNKKFPDLFSETSLTLYLGHLNNLQHEIYEMFHHVPNNKFIQWHNAWNDFAKENHLHIIGTLEHGHGDQPSIKEFNSIASKAKSEKVQVIVVGLNVKNSTLNSLEKAINGKIIRLDTIGDPKDPKRATYIKLMRHNAELLTQALQN